MTTTWTTDAQVYAASALAFPALTALNRSLVAAGQSATTMDALRVEAQAEVVADLLRYGDGYIVSTSSSGTVGASGTPYPIMGTSPGLPNGDDPQTDPVRFSTTTAVESVLSAVDRRRLETARVLVTLFAALAQLTVQGKEDTYEQARMAQWTEYQRLLGTLLPTGGVYAVG